MEKNNFYNNFGSFTFNDDGSFTCSAPKSFDCDELQSLAVALLWENSLDFLLSGEDGCVNNFDMYTPLYNAYNRMEYLIPYSVSDEWRNGKIVTVYGKVPDEEDMKRIEHFIREN